DLEADAAHRLDAAPADVERDGEILDREQRAHASLPAAAIVASGGGGAFAKILRGSNASRTPSPTKISSASMPPITAKPESPSHGAVRLFLPWFSSSPSDGDPGGRPKPRKSSRVSAVIAPDSTNGRNESAAVIAFGRMCRAMMTASVAPSARAART